MEFVSYFEEYLSTNVFHTEKILKIPCEKGAAVRKAAYRSRRLIKTPAAELKLEDLEIRYQRRYIIRRKCLKGDH